MTTSERREKILKEFLGVKFNNLTIIGINAKASDDRKETMLDCKCDCGRMNIVRMCDLRSGKTKTCGLCRSIGQYLVNTFGDNAIDRYWSKKNSKSPFDVGVGAHTKIWINCVETNYHGDYEVMPSNFVKGARCAYCTSKLTHPMDSFAQYHITNTDKDFLEKYWDYDRNTVDPFKIPTQSSSKVWIKCATNLKHGSNKMTVSNFTLGNRCQYCSHKKIHMSESLGSKNLEVFNIWSDKNKKSPYEYSPMSGTKVWWKCRCGEHEDYQRTVACSSKKEFRCPQCVRERTESFLQEKVRVYLTEALGYELNHEWECTLVPKNPKTKNMMPFDNEVVDLKLIVEVHGSQHYELNSYSEKRDCSWNRNGLTKEESLRRRKLYDRYKWYCAYMHGYEYLEIPYWTENNEKYKELIDIKIKQILKKKG